LIAAAGIVSLLAACQTSIDTHGADAQTAGRCKLMAYKEDHGHLAFGLIPAMIVQHNADAQRQDVYDSCVAAAGMREQPAETP
jgi:hypothetical protein